MSRSSGERLKQIPRRQYAIINLPDVNLFANIDATFKTKSIPRKKIRRKALTPSEKPPHQEWQIINEMSANEIKELIDRHSDGKSPELQLIATEAVAVVLREFRAGNLELLGRIAALSADDISGAGWLKVRNLITETKPPVPGLSPQQVEEIKEFARSHKWPGKRGTSADWVRKEYARWIPGLLREHLKLDSDLYQAFSRLARKGQLPDDLDVPTADENALRRLSSIDRAKLLAAREIGARRASRWREGIQHNLK